MKKIFSVFLVLFSLAIPVFSQNFYRNISVRQADRLITKHEGDANFALLDVRSPGEFEKGYIRGAANINFWGGGFADSVSVLDKKKTYLVYCASGVRSSGAMKKMRSLGFEKIYNMKGGMFAWRAARMPVEKSDE